MIRDLYLKYIKNDYNSIKGQLIKNVQRPRDIAPKKIDVGMASEHMKRASST
jgi:hypothetical protein